MDLRQRAWVLMAAAAVAAVPAVAQNAGLGTDNTLTVFGRRGFI